MKEKIVLRVGSQVDDLSMSALFGGVGSDAMALSVCSTDVCSKFCGSNCGVKCSTNCLVRCSINCKEDSLVNCGRNCESNCGCNCGVNDTAKCPQLVIQGSAGPVLLGF